MPQILLTEENFINDSVIEIKFNENIAFKFDSYRVGLCYISAAFKKSGTKKITITSHSVSSYQHINQWNIIGTFFNDNPDLLGDDSELHFMSESKNPQIFGELLSRNKLDIKLFNADLQPIRKQDLEHLGICIVFLGN